MEAGLNSLASVVQLAGRRVYEGGGKDVRGKRKDRAGLSMSDVILTFVVPPGFS